jgi:hypothetical protein
VFATADGYLALAMPGLRALGEVLGLSALATMDENVDGHTRRDEITAMVRFVLPSERRANGWPCTTDGSRSTSRAPVWLRLGSCSSESGGQHASAYWLRAWRNSSGAARPAKPRMMS